VISRKQPFDREKLAETDAMAAKPLNNSHQFIEGHLASQLLPDCDHLSDKSCVDAVSDSNSDLGVAGRAGYEQICCSTPVQALNFYLSTILVIAVVVVVQSVISLRLVNSKRCVLLQSCASFLFCVCAYLYFIFHVCISAHLSFQLSYVDILM
jgi:hypothetical protein